MFPPTAFVADLAASVKISEIGASNFATYKERVLMIITAMARIVTESMITKPIL